MNNIKIIETDFAGGRFWHESSRNDTGRGGEMKALVVYPKETETTIRGFGGAFTEAAAHTYAQLEEGEKQTHNCYNVLWLERPKSFVGSFFK